MDVVGDIITQAKDTIYCSFCGKSQHEVRKIVAGPGRTTFICDECIELCNDIVREEREEPAAHVADEDFYVTSLKVVEEKGQLRFQTGSLVFSSVDVAAFDATGHDTTTLVQVFRGESRMPDSDEFYFQQDETEPSAFFKRDVESGEVKRIGNRLEVADFSVGDIIVISGHMHAFTRTRLEEFSGS